MGEKKRRLAAGRTPEGAALEQAARARALFAQGAFGPALEHLAVALQRSPHIDALWAQFADLIRFYNLRDPLPPRLRTLLERALEHRAVDPGDLVRPISSAALSRAGNPLDEPLLLRLMRDTVIRDPALEDAIVAARRDPTTPLDTLVAIAHQCFNAEYVFEDGGFVPPAPADDPRAHALYAAYKPLDTGSMRAPASLVKRQIDEPAEEARLRATIPSIGETASEVSARVRAQYEENPYPRWVRVPIQPISAEGPRRILIAGCGTGHQAIATARHLPSAQVLAIDLSLASLAYAKRKSLELGVSNIEYRHGDLLSLHSLSERFEQIEASGVLHHLEDPVEGWRVLAELLAPGGRMRVGLYSERARRHVVRARELIAKEGFKPTPAGIRAARAAIRARASDELFARFLKSEDFYSMSGCRDLLFHVQEHRFSLPQIGKLIQDLGLEFTGFEFADAGISERRYRERFPGDASMTNLGDWDRLEADFPDTFARMYQFWVKR